MIQRWAEPMILSSMDFIDITTVVGPRQVGKTTLGKSIAKKRGLPFLSLDDLDHYKHASSDPMGFIKDHPKAFIDEIQRVPELILAIKYYVDQNRSRGRYLISGSVDLFRGGIAPDSLAGRMEIIELLPFAHREVHGKTQSTLIEEAFRSEISPQSSSKSPLTLSDLALIISDGGYPKVNLDGYKPREKKKWLRAHLNLVAEHDLPFLEDVRKKHQFINLIKYLSSHSAQLMNLSTFAASLSLTIQTIERWLALLENMFIIKRLNPWHKNTKKRLSKAPKFHFIDTGILTALQDDEDEGILTSPAKLGPFLENYIFTELSKILASSEERISLYHFRERNHYEVDLVLQKGKKIVGVEVKTARGLSPKDFSGLKRLKEICGEDFVCGMVLHPGEEVRRRDENLFSVPLERLLHIP